MNGEQLTMSLEELAAGTHEHCFHCKKPFSTYEGKLERLKTLDGRYVCSSRCGSAPFLTPRRYTGM